MCQLVANTSELAVEKDGKHNKDRFVQFGPGNEWRDTLNTRVRSEPHRDEWKEVRTRLADSRYSMPILIAMAEHIVVHAADPVEGGRQASNFIIGTVERGRNFGSAPDRSRRGTASRFPRLLLSHRDRT